MTITVMPTYVKRRALAPGKSVCACLRPCCPPREPIGRRPPIAETTELIKAIISHTVTAKVF